ncbi:MAG: glycosyltransferase family 4 protein [Candidatus Methylomirabilales bacterium]
MRLLFLTPAPPSPSLGGGSLRMYHVVRFLAERFDLDLIAPALEGAEEAERSLLKICSHAEFVPPSRGGLRRRWLRVGPYERDPALAAVVLRRLQSGAYGALHVEKPAMLPYLPRETGIPVTLDTFAYGLIGATRALRHERGLLTRARNLLRLVRFAAFDAFCWPSTHCILVVSEVDRQRCLRQRPGRRVLVIPNGVDCARIRPAPVREDGPPILVFTGDMSFEPNIEAAGILASRVFPAIQTRYPTAELRLVGRNPAARVSALLGPGIIVTGEVPDMLPHLHSAMVYVAPLATGAGTRTKLLEAMAAGLPIVTTRVGIEGIDAVDGQQVILADDPEAFTAAVLRLLADLVERRRLGGAARRLAEDRYDWSRCLAPLEPLYAQLLSVQAPRC